MKNLLLVRNPWTNRYAAAERFGCRGRSRHFGLSLIEMMVVVALLSVLAGISVPIVAGFVAASRIEDVGRRMAQDPALARNEGCCRSKPGQLQNPRKTTD